MKRSKIRINGQVLSEVKTLSVRHNLSNSLVLIGSPDVFVREDDDGLSVQLPPMALAQLYYDGVLPQDRSISVRVKLEGEEVRTCRIDSLVTIKDQWERDVLVLRLVGARVTRGSEPHRIV